MDDPVGRAVERHDADLVTRRHRGRSPQNRLLADVDLADAGDPRAATATGVERVAVAGVHRARLVDDDDERDVGLLLPVADAHVDRQRLLDRRLLVPACAERMGPADHHEALAEVADVDLEGQHLAVREVGPGDVDEDDRVVFRERERVRREALRGQLVDLLALRLERPDQFRGDRLVARHDERPRLALDDRVRVGPVVLAERVQSGLDDDAEAQEARVRGLDPERDRRRTRVEVEMLLADLDAVREQPHRRRLGGRRADVGADLDLVAKTRRRRGGDPLDEDLLGRAQANRLRLDLDPARRRERRLGLTLAGRVVAVGEQHDPLLGVVREQRRRQSQRAADVGRGRHRRRGDPVDLAELGRQPLDERALAERHDPRDVVLGHGLQAVPDERQGVLASRLADAVRQVDHEDRREPVDRQDEPEPGQREDERRQQQRPDD